MPVKKQNKKSNTLFTWLKPVSTGKKVLLFVLVFAIFGGLYYLYQSRAATLNRPPHVCAAPRARLTLGSTGPCVAYVQWTLDNYAGQKIPQDSYYDVYDIEGVMNFQTAYKLPVTGVVDTTTWEQIDSLIAPINSGTYRYACQNIQFKDAQTGILVSAASLKANVRYNTLLTIKNMGSASWAIKSLDGATITGNVDFDFRTVDGSDNSIPDNTNFRANFPAGNPTIVTPKQTYTFWNKIVGFNKGDHYLAFDLTYKGQSFGPDCNKRIVVN